MQLAKFHSKSQALYGLSQIAENIPVVISADDSTGTATVASGGTSVSGSGTTFLTQVTPKAYLYSNTGVLIGQIANVASDTSFTLVDPALAAVSGTFAIGLGPKNALAALSMNYSTELTTDSFQYAGDELSRDEVTEITDKFGKLDFEAFMPKRGTIAGANPTVDEIPMADWFQSSGFGVILSTDSSGKITYTNSLPSNEYMTIEVRRSSLDINTDKVYTLTDCRGAADPVGKVGSKIKMKFNYLGNLKKVEQKTKLVPDYEDQKFNIAARMSSNNISLSRLTVYTSGVEPADLGPTNFCFSELGAPNASGFEFDRYQTSCEDGWSKGAVPTDVTVTIIEDAADALYNPDDHLEAGSSHTLALEYGVGAGDNVRLYWHKINISNVASAEVAKYSGQALTYRNVDTLDITLS